MDKLSYALGLSMGNNFKGSGIQELNVDDFAAAVRSVYDGSKPEMTIDEAKQVVTEFFTELEKRQVEMNREVGKRFLEENAKKEGVKVTASGLQYKIVKEGNGIHPSANDKVTVHYTGRLIDGTVFDSSYKRNAPADFGLQQVIAGWTEGVQLMAEGAKYRFYIPYMLAYGEGGAGASIPPFATLIFDVELIKVL